MSKLGIRVSASLSVLLFLTAGLATGAFAQTQTPVFTPGNLVVTVSGCATEGGTCTNVPYSGNASMINGPAGGYSDDQGSPWTLFQYSVNGASSATFVNSLQLPQLQSGANLPISNDYGSLSEGTLQLSGDGRFMTITGYGLNAATFNSGYLNYCPGSTDAANACVPENDNPAMAQTGSLVGQSYAGNIPVPRVAALIDPYGNVNTSTVLYNISNQNDARSAYTLNGSTVYVSVQGCKTYSADGLCDGNSTSPYDDTMGVYLSAVGVTNDAPTPITGPDNGPTGCTSLSTCDSSIDTRMVTVYNGTVYVSLDSKPGSSTGGYNRSYIGTLGAAGATTVFTCAGQGAGCPSGDGPYGPALMAGFGNTGGTGKYTLNTAGSGNNSNGNSLSVGLAVNLAPQNFFFASPTVLYVADTGFPKNNSNGPDPVCTADGGKSSATVGDGGLQKWILNPTVTVTLTSGSKTASASSGAFTQGEVGLPITGTGIPAGTTITAVSSAGANATLSANATVSHSESVTVSGWSLAYTLYNGLNLVLNGDCNPNTPIGPGGDAATGLYGVTGVVSGGVATLYVTSYPNNDLINSYLYGITDTLSTTEMPTATSTAFTLLATAPSDSVFRGVSMAPSLPNGSETITSTPSGLTFTTSGAGCAAGTYITPFTLSWTPGNSCTLSVAATQTVSGGPVNPVSTTYNFISWQDTTTNPASDTVTAPSTTGTYNVSFQTVPTVVFPTASAIAFGQTLASSTLTGGSASVAINGTNVPGTFAWTNSSTVPAFGTSSQNVTFTPADTSDYASVPGTVSVTAGQAATAISNPPTASAITYGQALSSSLLTGGSAVSGTAPVSGTFAFTTPTTVPPTGTSSQSITFTPNNTTDYASVTGTVNVTVNQATTTISTAPTASAITYGQALSSSSLTGGSAASGTTSVPGTFAFTTPATVPTAGTAAQSITFTPTDSTDYTSAAGTVNVTVSQAAAVISISNTTQTYSGSPEGVTVTTTPPGLGITVSYTGTGSTTYGTSTTAPTNPGTYSVLVTVVDPNYAGQQSGTLTINQADPTVSLAVMSGQPASTPFGTTVYFDMSTVTLPQCPTGTAQLYVDGTASGSPVTLTSNTCSQPIQFQIATLSATTHSIYVAYSGDAYFIQENSTPALSYTVTQDSTTVTLATSGTPINVGQSVTFTATVTPTPNNVAPGGNVTFLDGTTQIGTGSTLTTSSPYQSTFSTTSLAAGSHSISATFTDTDGNFVSNSSGVDVEVVNLIVPTFTWAPAPTTFAYGTPIGSGQLNATSPVDGNGNPVSGTFSYNFASGAIIPVGTANLTATFTPTDPTTYSTASQTVTLIVNQATPTVSVWPTASAINYGQTLSSSTLTGGTASTPGAFAFTMPSTAPAPGTAAQSVTFTPTDVTDYTSVTGTVNVTVNQLQATITITNTTQTYSASPEPVTITTNPSGLGITVSYTGTGSTTYGPSATAPTAPGTYSVLVTVVDPNYAGQQSGTLTINQADPTVSLGLPSGAPTITPYGTTVYFVLSTATTPQCPTGTAQLYVDGAASGSPVNLPSPTCATPLQFQIATLTEGAHSIYATYSGDTYFESENTGTLSYTVAADTTTVTLATSASSVNVGQSLTFTATVTPAPPNNVAPTGTVTFYNGTTAIGTGTSLSASAPYTSTLTTTLPAGSYNISATFVDTDGNFAGSSSTVAVSSTVNLIVPTINFSPSPNMLTYGTPLGSGQLDATAVDSTNTQIPGTFGYNYSSGAIIPVGTVNLIATFTPADPTTYASNSASATLTVTQATPTISTPPTASAINYGQTLASSTLTGGSAVSGATSVPGNFTFTTPSTAPGPGTAAQSVTFTPTATADYTSVTGTVNVTVNKARPTVTFTGAPASAAYESTFTVVATTNASTTATITASGACKISGVTVTITAGSGTCLLTASWAADANYLSASATQSTVAQVATPIITWATPAAITYGTALNGTQLDATANFNGARVAGTLVYTPSAGTVLNAGPQTLSVTFTPSNTSEFASATDSVPLTVNQAAPRITWAKPAAITYGTALSGTQLNATATVSGTFVYSPPGGTVLTAGTQTLSVTFTPSNTDYAPANASVTLTVNPAATKIIWATPAAITYGTALSSTQLDATAPEPGSFVYSPAAGTVPAVGTQTLSVTFTPTDTTDYTTQAATTKISVGKATPTIAWPTPASISYGTALSATQLDATASVPGTYVYSPAAGAVLAGGAQTLSVTFTPTNTTDYSTAKASVTLQVTSSKPTIAWGTPAAITYGTALSGAQLDAKAIFNGATVAGTYVYTPASGTVLKAGTQTLSVVFTPSNTSDYSTASGSVTLQVNQATPKITWAKPTAITYGTALSATQLDATASVAGSFVYSPPAGTVLAVGTQTLSVLFTPTDTTDYTTQTASTTITVKQ